jgi:hypothetical protein
VALILDWDGIPGSFDVYLFFMDDFTYVSDAKVCMYSMTCYIPGCICYGSRNFVLGSLRHEYFELACSTPQFYSVAPFRFDYRFVDEEFIFYI